jgi:hypothetical protein
MARTQPDEAYSSPPDHTGVMLAAAALMALGWGGLYLLVTETRPFVGERWQFFLLLHVAVASSALPFIRYLNLRFTPITRQPPAGDVLVRQSVWVGLFAVTCAWLQIARVLTPAVAFFVALALIVIEVFLRSREIPNEHFDDEPDGQV